MLLKRLTDTNERLWEEAFALCESAFPSEERRDRGEILRVMKNSDYHFCVLLEGEDSAVTDFLIAAQSRENCAILCYSEEKLLLDDKNIIDVGARDDLSMQAQTLFAALRNTNSMSVDVIYAHLPTQSGIGLALYNRLIRAAAHTIKHID